MTLNCKAGDLAIVVKSKTGNEGKVIRCIRIATDDEVNHANLHCGFAPYWRIDGQLQSQWGRLLDFAPDQCLRPIRDSDGDDEMIRIAGLPLKEHA